MTDRLFLRRDTLGLTAILALPEVTGQLYVYDIIPEVVWNAVKVLLFPAWFLDLVLGRSVLYNGVAELYGLLIVSNGMGTPTTRLLWDIGIVLFVMYTVAIVSIYVGLLLASAVDVVPNEPWWRAVVGTLLTAGVISLVANVTQWMTPDPVERQIFHPEAVAGSLTLAILGVVVLLLHQTTSLT